MAKARLLALFCGGVFGCAGLTGLGFAFAMMLEPHLGLTLSVGTVAAVYLAIACFAAVLAWSPGRSARDELAAIEGAAAEALARLPKDALRSAVRDHPTTTLLGALALGFVTARDPQGALDGLGRWLRQAQEG